MGFVVGWESIKAFFYNHFINNILANTYALQSITLAFLVWVLRYRNSVLVHYAGEVQVAQTVE